MGYQNVGQTVDWNFPEQTNRSIEVTRELGFTEIEQTMEFLLGMATYRPLLELTNFLGFQDCRKTIEWLLNETQQNIAANFPSTALSPLPSAEFATRYSSPLNIPPQFPLNQVVDTVSSSNPSRVMYNNRPPTQTLNLGDLKTPQSLMHRTFGNPSVPDQMMAPNLNATYNQFQMMPPNLNATGNLFQMMPPNPNATGNQFHVGETQGRHDQFRMINSEPRHPLQFKNATSRWLRGNPRHNQFQTNGRGLQGGPRHAENKFSNWIVGQEVSMQQSSQARNNLMQRPNNNHIDQHDDVNNHIQMPYPAQSLNQGHPNMRRRMEEWYLGNQLQPQFPTYPGRRKPFK
jgi:hypothetical protein